MRPDEAKQIDALARAKNRGENAGSCLAGALLCAGAWVVICAAALKLWGKL